jgi:small multidrug resistance family-3 protein
MRTLPRELTIVVLVLAATLEVAGDAFVRAGLRGRGIAFVVLGFLVLGSYGLVVNLLDLDFSRLLGVYIGVFAVVSVMTGRLVFHDRVPISTWSGLAIILTGSLVIYVGQR